MLRWALVLLLGANVLTWAYQQGHLAVVGWPLPTTREPERLNTQVAPDKLEWRLAGTEDNPPATPPAAPETPVATPPAPTACWQAGTYAPAQAEALQKALVGAGMPTGWTQDENVLPARWIVYLGKLPNADALQRRKTELRQAKVDFRDVNNPALQPGLALGTYSTDEAAQQALQDIAKAGIKGAKVVQERPDTRTYTFQWAALTAADKDRISAMPALAGKALQACP